MNREEVEFLAKSNKNLLVLFKDNRLLYTTLMEMCRNGVIQFQMPNTNEDMFNFHELNKVLNALERIVEKPQYFIKRKEIITNPHDANELDEQNIEHTIADPKSWMRANNMSFTPKEIYSGENEISYATYENKVLRLLIDDIIVYLIKCEKVLSTYIKSLLDSIPSIDGMFDVNYAIKHLHFDNKQSYLIDSDDTYFEKLLQSRKFLRRARNLMQSEMYKEVMQEARVQRDVTPTNIFMTNSYYEICYRFFISGYLSSPKRKSDDIQFYNLSFVKFLYDLGESGYEITKNSPQELELMDEKIIANGIVLKKNDSIIKINTNQDTSITIMSALSYQVIIKGEKEKKSTSYLIKFTPTIYSSAEIESFVDETIDNPYDNVYILSDDILCLNQPHTMIYSPVVKNSTTDSLIASFYMMIPGRHDVYSQFCPVCRSKFLEYDNYNYSCESCNSKYSLLKSKNKEHVYLKRIGK